MRNEERKQIISKVAKNKLYFAKVKENAIIPTKRTEDAGYDVYTCEKETIAIEPCSTRMIDTGIAIACHSNYFPKFFDKGGMGSKGIIVGAGVGDSGYRNSYFVPLINTNKNKTLVITTQTKNEIEKSNFFNLDKNKFENILKEDITKSITEQCEIDSSSVLYNQIREIPFNIHQRIVSKEDCIIKPITKAFTQFVMIPVPELQPEELTWEELKNIHSERGLGNLGSSGK